MPLKVLLDTNVWAYVSNDMAANDLRRIARKLDLEVLVPPQWCLSSYVISMCHAGVVS
jgi:predicted nucleic acid-binding protein